MALTHFWRHVWRIRQVRVHPCLGGQGVGPTGVAKLRRAKGVVRVHRNFRVVRPTRHSSIVMIQKRTTTCVSFQPLF